MSTAFATSSPKGENCPTCGSSLSLPLDRFQDDSYINWIKGSLCLQLTKEGLESFVGSKSMCVYKDLLKHISKAKLCPYHCQPSQYNVSNYKCPSNTCDALRTVLFGESMSGCLSLNTASLVSMETNPAEVAKLYMPPICNNYSGPQDGDITAILAFMSNCLRCLSEVQNQCSIDEVRNSRNTIMHSGTMRITQQELTQHTDRFLKLLTDPKYLRQDKTCIDAVRSIEKIIKHGLHVDLVANEKTILDRHGKHIKSEIDALILEFETGKCTACEIRNMKQTLTQIVVSELKREAVMEIYGIETSSTEITRQEAERLQERLEDDLTQKVVQEKEHELKIVVSELKREAVMEIYGIETSSTEITRQEAERLQERLEDDLTQKVVQEKEHELKIKSEAVQSSQDVIMLTKEVTQLKDTVSFLVNQGISKEVAMLYRRQAKLEEEQIKIAKKKINFVPLKSDGETSIHFPSATNQQNQPLGYGQGEEIEYLETYINQNIGELKNEITILNQRQNESEKTNIGIAKKTESFEETKYHIDVLYESVSEMWETINHLSTELSTVIEARKEETREASDANTQIVTEGWLWKHGGQNKNHYMIGYLQWRILTGKNDTIEYQMQIPGHAKCLVDSGFGHLKKLYRRSNTETLDQLTDVVEKSSEVNSAVRYPEWKWMDWKKFLEPVFKPIPGIRKYQYFRMAIEEPGMVTVRTGADEPQTVIDIRKQNFVLPSYTPDVMRAEGLSRQRQEYLYKNVRPYLTEASKDITCPAPV